MDKQYLQTKLDGLRQQYVESNDHEAGFGQQPDGQMSKKMLKIKKKLVSLQMERCQRKIEHRDFSKIDQKILEQKQLFERYSNEQS